MDDLDSVRPGLDGAERRRERHRVIREHGDVDASVVEHARDLGLHPERSNARTAMFVGTQLEEGRSHRQMILAALLAVLIAGYVIFLTLSWPLAGPTLVLESPVGYRLSRPG